MSKLVKVVVLLIAILLTTLAAASPRVIQALDPSFPTRTPTPGPGQPPIDPTATSGSPGDPGNPVDPSPTEAQPGAPGSGSPQPILTGTPGASGPGGAMGTALPTVALGGTIRANPGGLGECSDTPYIRANDRLIVYGGPGMDYGPVSTLAAEEMRPIIGRARYSAWWQIQVKPNLVGWVQDREVDEFGNTALVPVVAPPTINGATPTPGAPWNPTPLPLLTCVPTPTPTATSTPTGTITAPGTGEETGVAGGQTATGEDSGGAAAPGGSESPSEMVQADIDATPIVAGNQRAAGAAVIETGDTISVEGLASPGSSASRTASPTSAMNLILPIAGIALIAAGVILALLTRSRGGKSSAE